MFHLHTFGALRIESDGGAAAPHLRRPWLAMLAVIAASEHGIARDRLMAIFWAESDEERARQSTRQALYGLRHELGHDVVRSVDGMLSLDAAAIACDVVAFRAALSAGDRAHAVAIASAPFLDAFHLHGAPAFERWMEEERARLAGLRTAALHALATEASRAGRADEAVEWWRALTETDPLSGRFAVGYLKALADCGDRAAALVFARKHGVVIRRELETDPDPSVRRLEAELRAMPASQSTTPSSVEAPAQADNTATAVALPGPSAVPPHPHGDDGGKRWRRRVALGGVAVTLFLVAVVIVARGLPGRSEDEPPIFAVGLVQEVGVHDTALVARVLTDMLATNLARVPGLRVVSNSRLLALLPPGTDSALSYADAARRAGATDLLEGHILARPRGLALELQRVDLRTGMVRDVFSVVAGDRYALVDSITVVMARHFRLAEPAASVATVTTKSAIAYRFYEEGLRAHYQDDASSARRLMRAALVEDSTFALAAYYEAVLARSAGDLTPDGRHASLARRTALRLAANAPDRERLMITANMLVDDLDPAATAVAESLASRYPEDPDAHAALGRVRSFGGDWPGAVAAFERAVALDSAAGSTASVCRVCASLHELTEVYLWADSLAAAERTARRHLAFRPNGSSPLYQLAVVSARRGESTITHERVQRLLDAGFTDEVGKLLFDLRLERYEEFERGLPELLAHVPRVRDSDIRWYQLIALRNQGRLREAERLHRTGALAGEARPRVEVSPDAFNGAILALARGEARTAARLFEEIRAPDSLVWARGHVLRGRAWYGTLAGMAWAAAGDTARVRVLADSVESWGRGSVFGRDRRAHHFLRGLLHVAARDDEEGARSFRAAIHSPTLGFTRVNYELARVLLRMGRSREAVGVLQPALRGELDAGNLYVTRTEVHELLAGAFDRTGDRDSAMVHYGAVVRAWGAADPVFHERRARAGRRLAELQGRGAGRALQPAVAQPKLTVEGNRQNQFSSARDVELGRERSRRDHSIVGVL